MSRYTIQEFTQKTEQKERGQGLFELEGERVLEVNLNGQVWTKKGSMIAYHGQVQFSRERAFEHGLGRFFKKALTGEGMHLTKIEGRGKVYLADQAKKITILQLQHDSIYVNGNDLLAFEPSIRWDIKVMKSVSGILAGGLFNIKLEGEGLIALTTHADPLTLLVKPGAPVCSDPNATVAWSGNLYPTLKTDISFRTFLGRGSGESLQMEFDGDGFVVVQPCEERSFQQASRR